MILLREPNSTPSSTASALPDALFLVDPVQHEMVLYQGAEVVRHRLAGIAAAWSPGSAGKPQ
jgi:hypothetical protein